MVYKSTEDIEGAVQRSINIFEAMILKKNLPHDQREELAQAIRQTLGGWLGLRTEDGQKRLYEITLLEGEPYVYDE